MKQRLKHQKLIGWLAFAILGIVAVMFISTGDVTSVIGGLSIAAVPVLSIKDGKILGEITVAEMKALTDDELFNYKSNLYKLQLQIFEDAQKEVASDVAKMKALNDKYLNDKELTTKQLEALTAEIKELQDKYTDNRVKSKKSFKDLLNEKLPEIEKFKATQSLQMIEIGTFSAKEFKAIEEGNIGGDFTYPLPQIESGIDQLPQDNTVIRKRADVGRTSSSHVGVISKVDKINGAKFTGENEIKGEGHFNFEVEEYKVRKITEFIKVTTEMIQDVAVIMSEIRADLLYDINNNEESGLALGDGVGENLFGLTYYGGVVDNAALQNIYTSGESTKYDAIASAVTQIRLEAKAKADTVYVNAVDYQLLLTEKNANGDYYFPNWAAMPKIVINGAEVVVADWLEQDEVVVADMRHFKIRDRSLFTISIGYSGEDFVYNRATVRAEKRLVSFVPPNKVDAFIFDTFSDIKAFIEA